MNEHVRTVLDRIWPLLVGVGITVGVDIILAVLPIGQTEKVLAAVTLAGIVLSLQFEIVALVLERGRRDEEVTNLIAALHRHPEFVFSIERLATLVGAVGRFPQETTTVREAILKQLGTASAALQQIDDGVIHSEKTDLHIMEEHYKKAKRSTVIRATTGDRDLNWWTSDLGQRYLEWNRQSKAQIRRIFVIDDESKLPQLIKVMTDNVHAKVAVWVVPHEVSRRLPEKLRRNVTIFGTSIFHQDDTDDLGRTIQHEYVVVESAVDEGVQRWEELCQKAEPWERFLERFSITTAGGKSS